MASTGMCTVLPPLSEFGLQSRFGSVWRIIRNWTQKVHEFPQAVIEALKTYVYRLEDPRDKKTFYVGKGTGNRVFHHAHDALNNSEPTDKLERIREILSVDLRPVMIVHRHGLDENTALQVEAALIDAYGIKEIANEQRGVGIASGMMTVDEVIELYGAPEATIVESVVLIKIEKEWHRDLTAEQLYERTRRYWIAAPEKRNPPPAYAMSVARGIIREVYAIQEWEEYPDISMERMDATRIHNDRFKKRQRRVGFVGRPATEMSHYIGQSVRNLQQIGNQNPIGYVNSTS